MMDEVRHFAEHLIEQAVEHGPPLVVVFAHDEKTCVISSGLIGEMSDLEIARLLQHAALTLIDRVQKREPYREVRQ